MSYEPRYSADDLDDTLVISGSGYSIAALQGRPSPDISLFNNIGPVEIDDIQFIEKWLLESVLRVPKNRKFMGLQDKLAVVAAARALISGNLICQLSEPGFQHKTPNLKHRCGVYMTMGYIPFEYREIAELSENSQLCDMFSMEQFSSVGMAEVNPLLTFRCLPNMPAFHVSMNFALQGPYMVSYPDIGQYYQVLNQAIFALRRNQIDFALVGGVADQNNFLVEHQLRKLGIRGQKLDCAGFLLLERKKHLQDRGSKSIMELIAIHSDYKPQNLLRQVPQYQELISVNDRRLELRDQIYAGPASLAVMLSLLSQKTNVCGEVHHRSASPGNIEAVSHWQIST